MCMGEKTREESKLMLWVHRRCFVFAHGEIDRFYDTLHSDSAYKITIYNKCVSRLSEKHSELYHSDDLFLYTKI